MPLSALEIATHPSSFLPSPCSSTRLTSRMCLFLVSRHPSVSPPVSLCLVLFPFVVCQLDSPFRTCFAGSCVHHVIFVCMSLLGIFLTILKPPPPLHAHRRLTSLFLHLHPTLSCDGFHTVVNPITFSRVFAALPDTMAAFVPITFFHLRFKVLCATVPLFMSIFLSS